MSTIVDIMLVLIGLLIVVLVWRGPSMLPRIGEALGRTVKGVRDEVPGALKGTDESTDRADSGEQRGP